MDVTQDTVAANNLLSGETATGADGVRLTGTLIPSSEPVLQEKTVTPTTSTQVVTADTEGDVICRVSTGVVSSNTSKKRYMKTMASTEKAIAPGASVYKIVGEFTVTYNGITTTITLDDYCAYYDYYLSIKTKKFDISPSDAAENSVPNSIEINGVTAVGTNNYFVVSFANSVSRTITVTKEIRVTEIVELTDSQLEIYASSDDGYGSPHTWTRDLSSFTNGDLVSMAGTVGDYFASDIATWENGFTIADSKTGVIIAATSSSITITNAANAAIDLYIGKAELASYYDGLSQVTVNPIPSQYIVPSGTKTITENGTGIDVASYASVDVNVSGGGGGGGGSASDDVIFIDYDGTIVDSYSAADFAQLSALPANPSHSGLTAQGWNWSLSDAKTYVAKYGQLVIGQMYITDDGKTRIYIHLEEGRTSPMLGCCPNGTVVVDWGDGSATDTLTGTSTYAVKWTPTHNYANAGDYVITLTVSGSVSLSGSTSTNGYSYILRYSAGSDRRNRGYLNGVKSVEIGSGVTALDSGAFYGCNPLSTITIPKNVTKINASSFNACQGLLSVTIPNEVTVIGDSAFNNCYSLSNISLPNGLTSVGTYTFAGNSSLSRIVLPDGPKTIGTSLATLCTSLSTVIIPDSVNKIFSSAFNGCYCLTGVTIPNGVTSIGSYAFQSCYNLLNISLPSGLTSLEYGAFNACHNLTDVTIPEGIISIESNEFSSCYRLTSITIPNGVTSIGTYAFQSCTTFLGITIPDSVTTIGASAFSECGGLVEIHFLPTTPPTVANANAWNGIPTDCKIYVPTGTLSAYTSAANYPDPATYTYIEE